MPSTDSQASELQQLNDLLRAKNEELRQTEAALRASEERYDLAVQGSHDGIWDWNIASDEVYYSPQFKAALGYAEDEISSKFSEFELRLHPEDRDRVLAAIQAHLTDRVPYDVEYRLRTKQGDYRWINARGGAIWDEFGQPLRMAGSITDTTERKQVEDALRESEARWQFALEGARDGVWDWDAKTNKVFFSHRWKAMIGYEDDEIGDTIEEWDGRIHPDDKERCYAALNQHLAGETPFYQSEHRLRCKDGSYRWVLDRGKVIERDAQGEVLRVIGTHTDITERKRAEESLRQLNEALETKVRDRTRELEQRAKDLERSNAELQQFAYVASHDLQEPLRTISSFTELLAQEYGDRLDGEAEEYVAFIVDGALRMQQLIKDLLAYSRVNSRGKAFAMTDCNKAIEKVLNNLQFSIEESKASITHAALPIVFADESQVQQLFQNLISNAIKFRGEQTPQVHISAERYHPTATAIPQTDVRLGTTAPQFKFCVSDNGIGIAADYREQIFEIFQRLHSRRIYAGTGIGLAICRKIVQRHGGRIWVEESAEAGAAFYFTLPAQPTEKAETFTETPGHSSGHFSEHPSEHSEAQTPSQNVHAG